MADLANKRLSVGDRWRPAAEQINRWNRASDLSLRGRIDATVGFNPAAGRGGIVLVKNASGTAVDRFGVLAIQDVLQDAPDPRSPAQGDYFENWILVGQTPTSDDVGNFVICAEPIPNGKTGTAFLYGACPAWINVQSTGDLYADVDPGSTTQLISGSSGLARILQAIEDTGPQWLVVRLSAAAQGGGALPTPQLAGMVIQAPAISQWAAQYPEFV